MFKKLVNNIRCCLQEKRIKIKIKGDKYDKEINRKYAFNTY